MDYSIGYYSTDHGTTWVQISNFPSCSSLSSVTFAKTSFVKFNNKFIMSGHAGNNTKNYWISTDNCRSFKQYPFNEYVNYITYSAYHNKLFMTTNNSTYSSNDGINWTKILNKSVDLSVYNGNQSVWVNSVCLTQNGKILI